MRKKVCMLRQIRVLYLSPLSEEQWKGSEDLFKTYLWFKQMTNLILVFLPQLCIFNNLSNSLSPYKNISIIYEYFYHLSNPRCLPHTPLSYALSYSLINLF